MVRLALPNRLKSYNGKSGETSQPESRPTSPGRSPIELKGLILKTKVLRVRRPPIVLPIWRLIIRQARNLAAKDKSGSSDPVGASGEQIRH